MLTIYVRIVTANHNNVQPGLTLPHSYLSIYHVGLGGQGGPHATPLPPAWVIVPPLPPLKRIIVPLLPVDAEV